ncbi:MAG: rfaE2 [Burkholderiales bacterium]|jgi:rfaE bifunctional protein nucleotidyltransferase chain/domain|nr:rfaE2 [Burkholderiales bacterium]MCE3268585.1 rfaE2 [Burkholderiales bacterium]
MQYKTPDYEKKIIKPENLNSHLKMAKRPLVFTNGCFDIIHRGHVTYLAQAKSLGNVLVVALNTDESVRAQGKGSDRPINNLANRMAVIASLEMVDYVTFFNTETPLDLILAIQPDVLVKGGDWSIEQIVGSREVLANGGTVHSIPFLYNTSTTNLINQIRRI